MTKEKILVIDDEEGLRNFCKRALTKEGYEVEVSSSGEEALALMKENQFALALIDLKMPGIDGIEVLKRIKKEYPRTEAIILTGYGSFESAVDALRLGADDYLTKPIDVAALLMAVKRCLEKRRLKWENIELKNTVALYEVSQAMTSLMDLNQLLNLILKLACDTLNAEGGSIMLCDPLKNELVVRAAAGTYKDKALKAKIKIGERVSGQAAERREPLLVIGDDPRFKDIKKFEKIKSGMSVPLLIKDKFLGTINLKRTEREEKFTRENLQLLSIFAQEAAYSIENAQTYEALKKVDRMKSEFIYNISHELLGPLSATSGAIDSTDIIMQEKKIKNENLETFMSIMRNNTVEMIRLIRNLSDFSKIETGKLEMKWSSINLDELLSDMVKEMKLGMAQNVKTPIEIKIPEVLPALYGDRGKLKIILHNLLSNALKFSLPDGKIIIIAQKKGEEVEIAISDTGIGISPEHQKKIFDKFYRVDSSLTQKVGGLGIGLSLVKKCVEVHNGRIWVESELNKGTKFVFTLPKGKPDV